MSHLPRSVARVEHHLEANCECGARWNFITDEDPDSVLRECEACGATVRDIRILGEWHSAGGDVAPSV